MVKKTINGKVIVEERENIGLSFGAFDYAFNKYRDNYDFWFFQEDDQITVKNNVFSNAIRQLMSIEDINVQKGYIATVVTTEFNGAIHAGGGCGITSKFILDKVRANNYSDIVKRGHLPYWHTSLRGAHDHNFNGEIRFTNAIVRLGYTIENSSINEITMAWRHEHRRSNLMIPYQQSLIDKFIDTEPKKNSAI